jgi:hypothetical protein
VDFNWSLVVSCALRQGRNRRADVGCPQDRCRFSDV